MHAGLVMSRVVIRDVQSPKIKLLFVVLLFSGDNQYVVHGNVVEGVLGNHGCLVKVKKWLSFVLILEILQEFLIMA